MKKQTMSLAVASALLVGGTAAFGEMHINGQGTGEALVYPFYSAANGNDTYIHIVNTSSLTKAVKIRFVDALNSQEVLDFNLYLSPEDVWAGAITSNPNTGATGAAIVTVDNSCTVPALGTSGGANVGQFAGTTETVDGKIRRMQPFVPFAFAPTDTNRTPARTLQGYVEVIEMGQLNPLVGLGAAAVHGANGVPANCGALRAAWNRANPTGVWEGPEGTGFELLPWQGGGLYGFGVVINVNEGTASGYDAVAVDDFRHRHHRR
ncbi:MAG: hypothetical protein IPG64_14195 [Haliea sp.]|nr:hypothetical protein [Haliea sp.]